MVKENKTLVIDKKITDEVACAHHWKINDPDGPTSSGFCKKCGIEKMNICVNLNLDILLN